jgi:hypothetical protein
MDNIYYLVPAEHSYSGQEFRTHSKLAAFTSVIGTQHVQLMFNQLEFDQVGWSHQPSDSLDELYRQRAQELRDQYDHLVLMYSGGIDSHNILETFLHNNIHLDEVCSFTATDVAPPDHLFNRETVRVAIPRLQEIQNSVGATRVLEVGQMIMKQFMDQHHAANFIYYSNGIMNPWMLATRSSNILKDTHFQHLRGLVDQGKRVGFVWGMDKPGMVFNQNENTYQTYMSDLSLDRLLTGEFRKRYLGSQSYVYPDESFYIRTDNPVIQRAQTHALMHHLESIPADSDELLDHNQLAATSATVQHWSGRWLRKESIDRVIYPSLPTNQFVNDKSHASVIFPERNSWFFQSTGDNRGCYLEQVRRVTNAAPDFFIHRDGRPWSVQYVLTKKYTVGGHCL